MTELAGAIQVVATPVHDLPGCDGAMHRSFVVVRADDAAPSVAAMQGRRCAINSRDSNTGMNLLRAFLAPLAQRRPFFASVTETGSHLESLEAVQAGCADLAAVDCVTYSLVARGQVALVGGLRILAQTAATPGLPLVTSVETPLAEVAALRSALAETAGHPAARALGWSGVTTLDDAAYDAVAALEREAASAGYPVLA